MGVRNYRDLIAWQKAVDLTEVVYEASMSMPPDERFGLTSQMRRAAVSVAANIAEGEGRGSKKEFARFLHIAHGSLREVETHIVIAGRLRFISQQTVDQILEQAAEVGRIITGLIRSQN